MGYDYSMCLPLAIAVMVAPGVGTGVYIFTSTKPCTMRKQLLVCLAFCLCFATPYSSFSSSVDSPSYIKKFKDIAIREMYRSGIPASITLAQAIHESAWGQGTLARSSNNYFGIKCKDYWTGPTYYIEDDDYQNGKLIKSCFRAYEDIENSFVDHSNFLRDNPRYKKLFTYEIIDYESWAKGLQSCGYATDKQYAFKLIRTIERHGLHQYDAPQVDIPALHIDTNAPVAAAPQFDLSQFLPAAPATTTTPNPPIVSNTVPYIEEESYEVPEAFVLPDDYQRGANRSEENPEEPLILGEATTTTPFVASNSEVIHTVMTQQEEVPTQSYPEATMSTIAEPAPVARPTEIPATFSAPTTSPAERPRQSESIMRMNYAGDSRASQLGRRPRVSNNSRR